jgi:hypothetical protein
MIETSIDRLQLLCDTIPDLLLNIDEAIFSEKPSSDKWSKKEIIGHLIDSAVNNHQRFVRAQFEDIPSIAYNQNKWNEYNYYQQMNKLQIISFWTAYNRQLVELIKRIPQHKLNARVNIGGAEIVTLGFLINDYVAHLEHHLKQVVQY